MKKKLSTKKKSTKSQPKKKSSSKKKLPKKELKEFRAIILKRKEAVIEELQHITDDTLKKSQKEASGDISGYTYHMADVATDNYDREFSLGLASNERRALYELDDALKRIDDETFGFCDDCKGLISKARLKAVPSARLCIKCQEKREKR
ncbi:MAG: TraR/DksA family transcriptional regulator [Candidatus Omnitrophica bacterium]|nr:TraR/DksA family transcriptional regulator [Candidatus Omnitrophota bacterium]MDD5770911.1 TraR/DksA family transcriptional regulator [Candidatus Omnitrophota bacterium]